MVVLVDVATARPCRSRRAASAALRRDPAYTPTFAGTSQVLARQVRADLRPTTARRSSSSTATFDAKIQLPSGSSGENSTGAVRSDAVVRPSRTGFGRDVLHLARAPVEARHLAAVDDVGVERIGRDVAVLLDADRVPIAKRDLPVVAAARDARRAALLLAAAHAIRKRVVGADVVELRRRLVVPAAPRLAAVER